MCKAVQNARDLKNSGPFVSKAFVGSRRLDVGFGIDNAEETEKIDRILRKIEIEEDSGEVLADTRAARRAALGQPR